MTFSKRRYSDILFRLSLVGFGQGVVKFSVKVKAWAKTEGFLAWMIDYHKIVSVACERQTFLLAHRRWGTMSEEKLLPFAGYCFRQNVTTKFQKLKASWKWKMLKLYLTITKRFLARWLVESYMFDKGFWSETTRLRLVVPLEFWTFWRHFYGR